jgi:hypothetical protein
MTGSTPEDRAGAFAARWFKSESPALRDIGCWEIAMLSRETIEAEKARSIAVSRGGAPKSG